MLALTRRRRPSAAGPPPHARLLALLALAFTVSAPAARAGSYQATFTAHGQCWFQFDPVYSLSDDAESAGPNSASAQGGTTFPAYLPGFDECAGTITVQFDWQPSDPNNPQADPPPQYAAVSEASTMVVDTVAAGGTTCTDGLGDHESDKPDGYGGVVETSQGKRFTVQGGQSFSVSCAPVGDAGISPADGGSGGTAGVNYSVSVSPITLGPGSGGGGGNGGGGGGSGSGGPGLGGTTPDGSGGYAILVGQQCSPGILGIPDGCTPSNYKWSVSGVTDQPGDWAVGPGQSNAAFSGPNASFTSTLAFPVWYWNDLAGVKTVTCTVTVTPPAGQGAAFTMTVTQNVTLDVPTYPNDEVIGVVQINDAYPPINRDAQGNPQNLDVYCLWAGPGPNSMPPNGIQFRDAVLTPSLYSGTGTWYHLQLPTPSKFRAGIPSQYNGLTGLDGSFPYGSTFNADGTVALHPDDDGPGFPLENRFQEYKVQSETYQDYIMYTPPGANSTVVPLAYFTWNWNADVKQPTGGWINATGMPTGGTVASSGAANREIIYPTWSRKASSGW